MKEIYLLTGMVVIIIIAIYIVGSVLDSLAKWIFNGLGKWFKIFWNIVEFVYYKKEFMEWVKDKDRYPNG
jgi:hypothetical protein